jgi:hypothetical protein
MIICQKERFLCPGMISLLLFVLIGRMEDPNAVVECFMTVHTVIIHVDILRQRNMNKKGNEDATDIARWGAEDRLLAELIIKCKECDQRMATGRQEGNRYYYCGNNKGHKDFLDRYVWVKMPEYLSLEGKLDTELSSEKETD